MSQPMSSSIRAAIYRRQRGPDMTPRQRRRYMKKWWRINFRFVDPEDRPTAEVILAGDLPKPRPKKRAARKRAPVKRAAAQTTRNEEKK